MMPAFESERRWLGGVGTPQVKYSATLYAPETRQNQERFHLAKRKDCGDPRSKNEHAR